MHKASSSEALWDRGFYAGRRFRFALQSGAVRFGMFFLLASKARYTFLIVDVFLR